MIATLTPVLVAFLLWLQPVQSGRGEGAANLPQKMVAYQLVLLKKGSSTGAAATPEGQKAIQAHLAHMYKLGAEGKAMAAGPFLDDGDIQRIMIVKAATPAEAREIGASDPAVAAGIFTLEVASFLSPDGWFGAWAEMGKVETVYFGFLNSGPNRGQDPETAKQLQAQHLAYMDGQAKEGKLVVAGPFTDGGARRGIVVYRVPTAAEAKQRAEGDPMVKAGRLAVELHPWQVPVGALPTLPR
jgi:uncharacterized protein YciI